MAEPTITFGDADSIFGTQTGWNPGGSTVNVKKSRASTIGGMGNETDSKLYDETTDASQNFNAASDSAPTVPETAGALAGDYILTSISINTAATDFHKMTLAGHNHAVNAHADTLQQGAHGITLSSGFGAEDFMGGTAGDSASVESSSVTITVSHVDSIGGATGAHVVGDNYTGMITATVTWIGTPTTPAAAGWDVTESPLTKGNTAHARHTYTGTKAFNLAVPTPP